MINRLYFDIEDKELKVKAFNAIAKEQDSIGYHSLPDDDISEILDFVKKIDDSIETVAVIGIGGSSLGAKAVYNFIKPIKNFHKELIFFESTDPLNIETLLNKINLKNTLFVATSKSGTTVETIAIFKYIYSLLCNLDNFIFITDSGSKLEKFAKKNSAKVFNIPKGVGGRFSILSSVGLVPLSLVGIDIKRLLVGASKIKESFLNNGYIKETLLKKALFIAKNHQNYNINVIFAYTEQLRYFTQWYVQLWGESLGKKQKHSAFNVGLTPIGLIGPKDQHSFLQLIVEGNRDKTITFLKIEDFQNSLTVPDISFEHLEELDILNNITFNDIITMQSEAVKESLLNKKDIPIDEIILKNVSEESIGELIYYYELLTSIVGFLIDVNTYNQPGVEEGKVILKNRLKDLQNENK